MKELKKRTRLVWNKAEILATLGVTAGVIVLIVSAWNVI